MTVRLKTRHSHDSQLGANISPELRHKFRRDLDRSVVRFAVKLHTGKTDGGERAARQEGERKLESEGEKAEQIEPKQSN